MNLSNPFQKATIRNFLFIPVVCLTLSGCIGGCFSIPDIKFTIDLIKGVTIPGGVDISVDKDVPLTKACGQFDIEKIKERVTTEIQKLPVPQIARRIFLMLVNNVEIKNLWIEKITLTATEGNFSRLTSVTLKIKIGNGEIDFGEGQFNSEKTSIVFQKKTDIYPFIKDLNNGGCVEGNIHIKYNSQTNIKFNVAADVSLKVSL